MQPEAVGKGINMRYKLAICDDNETDRAYVLKMLQKWANDSSTLLASGSSIETKCFISAEQFLFQYAEEKDFDILLLDIEMGKMDGVSLAKKLREENDRLQIIFVTGFPDFIAEGYEVNALHYLMKPVNEEKLFKTLEKALNNLAVAEKAIYIQQNGETTRIKLKDILFVEVFSHSCTIHTVNGELETKRSISELENDLGEGFARAHRSFLVNLERIRKISKTEILLENGDTVPMSRRQYTDVNMAFIRWMR